MPCNGSKAEVFMKARFFTVLLLSVLLTGSFSLPVSAGETDDGSGITENIEEVLIDEAETGLTEEIYTEFPEDPALELIEEVSDQDLFFYADGESLIWTVTFDSRGGTPVDPQSVHDGEKAGKPEDPKKGSGSGAYFDGWYTEDGSRFDFNNPVRSDIALFAKWEPIFILFPYNISNDNETAGGRVSIKWVPPQTDNEKDYADIASDVYRGIKGYSGRDYYLKESPNIGYLFKGWYKGRYEEIRIGTGDDFIPDMAPLDMNDASNLLGEESEYSSTLSDDGACICAVFEPCLSHEYVRQFTKATPEKDGRWVDVCSKCRYPDKINTIPMPKTYKLSASSFTCDGKAKKPSVTITDAAGKVIPADHYSVSYLNNTMPGTAKVRVTFLSDQYEGTKDIPFTILKAPGTMTAKGKTVKLKAAEVAKKKQKIKAAKAITVSGAKGKVTYKKVKGNKKIKVSSGGKITVKKGLKKGTYKVRICVTDAGSASVAAKEQVVTVRIKVK